MQKFNVRQSKNGKVSFTFIKNAVSDVTFFRDSPESLTGELDIDDFIKLFDELFGSKRQAE